MLGGPSAQERTLGMSDKGGELPLPVRRDVGQKLDPMNERTRHGFDAVAVFAVLWLGILAVAAVRRPRSGDGGQHQAAGRVARSQTFDLRCEVRGKMIAFLKAEYPQPLPRER